LPAPKKLKDIPPTFKTKSPAITAEKVCLSMQQGFSSIQNTTLNYCLPSKKIPHVNIGMLRATSVAIIPSHPSINK